jgi:hypothetical protein
VRKILVDNISDQNIQLFSSFGIGGAAQRPDDSKSVGIFKLILKL